MLATTCFYCPRPRTSVVYCQAIWGHVVCRDGPSSLPLLTLLLAGAGKEATYNKISRPENLHVSRPSTCTNLAISSWCKSHQTKVEKVPILQHWVRFFDSEVSPCLEIPTYLECVFSVFSLFIESALDVLSPPCNVRVLLAWQILIYILKTGSICHATQSVFGLVLLPSRLP